MDFSDLIVMQTHIILKAEEDIEAGDSVVWDNDYLARKGDSKFKAIGSIKKGYVFYASEDL